MRRLAFRSGLFAGWNLLDQPAVTDTTRFGAPSPRGLKSGGASSAEEPPVALTATDPRGVRAADSHHGASVSLCLDGRVGAVRAPATLALTACAAWSASMRPAV